MQEGDSIPGFPSVDLLIYLLQPKLEKIHEPAIHLIHDVYYILEEILEQAVDKAFCRFP